MPFPAHLDPRAVRSGAGQLPAALLFFEHYAPRAVAGARLDANGWFAPTDGRAA